MSMKARYDHLVVGSGAAGLTAALLLALNGRSVLLIEKAPHVGGSLARFRLKGIPFDTGFHFTGGFSPGGLLDSLLRVLGLRDQVQPVFLDPEHANRFLFESSGRTVDLPAGQPLLTRRLCSLFPGEQNAIVRYFDLVDQIRRKTHTMDLRQIDSNPEPVDEDFVSLHTVLDRLTGNAELKAVLSGFAMCYGTAPTRVSFAAHCRMCHGLYESVARLERGGETLVDAFLSGLEKAGVDIACSEEIDECLDLNDRQIGRVRLHSGHEVSFESVLFTIHPRQILSILPEEHLSQAFIHRVQGFEASAGFFTLFALENGRAAEAQNGIESIFPSVDVNAMLDAWAGGDSAIVLMRSREEVNGVRQNTLTAFEPCFEPQTARWADSATRRRPPDYYEWKKARTTRMCKRITAAFPELDLQVLESASPLTFRDYLHSPDGSAYGIQQKMGQFNLIGRLPWRNMYAAGQSALLPGVVGAMMSSFLVARSLLGRTELNQFINRRLTP